MDTFLAMAIKPFVVFILLVCICLPARIAVQRFMPDGKIKRLLLRKVQ